MIAFAHYSSTSDISGVTSFLGDLIRELRIQGYPVALQLHHLGGDPMDSDFRREMSAVGALVESVGRPEFRENGVRATLEFLARHQPRIFLPNCLNEHFYAAAIGGRQGLPWAMALHSDDPAYWIPLAQVQPEKCRGMVVPVSRHIASIAEAKGHACWDQVIPYGVPSPSHTTRFNPDRFRVVYCGRVIEEQKRISLVIESIIQACTRNSKIEGRVIGGGAELNLCVDEVQRRGMGDRITFAGRLESVGVAAELSQAQAILFMSDYEGLPVSLLEAMVRGVVPVARLIPSGIPELVEEGRTGCLVDHSPAAAAGAIDRLARDPEHWRRLSAMAIERVTDNYTRSGCHQRWIELIERQALPMGSKSRIRVPRFLRIPRSDSAYPAPDPRIPSLSRRIHGCLRAALGRLWRRVQSRS